MIGMLFNTILYRPIFNFLVFLHNIIPGHQLWLAIIVLTVVIKIILLPISYQAAKSRKKQSVLQPQIKEIQKKYKNKEEQSRELMKLYKENKANPLSGCLPLIVQLVVVIALYRAFMNIFKPESFSALYSFVQNPGVINVFMPFHINLSLKNYAIAIIAAIAQFFSSKMMAQYTPSSPSLASEKQEAFQKTMQKQMIFFAPLMTLFIGMSFPSGVTFYWAINSILELIQNSLINKKIYGKDKGKNQTNLSGNGI